jgi:DNA-binding XRE family transcriptional regulator
LELGLFQKQVAEQIGVDEETIFRWESNKSRPQVRFIPATIKFLDYNPLSPPDSPRRSLVFYRQMLGLSLRNLGKRIGVDPKVLGLCERGRRPLSKKILKLLESF